VVLSLSSTIALRAQTGKWEENIAMTVSLTTIPFQAESSFQIHLRHAKNVISYYS
jgi:hypothetical protein